ncbi:hypothetical protein [Acinetobacter sp.]|uniref:hypothetical protein n=1 Tax=Acinetobacter sp. TaxID=472 RepID=UPI00375026A0
MKIIDKRREKRIAKEQFDKKVLSLERENAILWKAKRDIPWIKLDEPIQRGWKRFFVLRDDVARRTDAHIIRDVLKRVNVTQYCDNEAFEEYNWKADQWYEMRHDLKPIGLGECERDVHLTERHRSYLYKGSDWFYNHGWKKIVEGYWFKDKWMLAQKIEPHFVTHYQELDAELEAKLAHIHKKLYDDWTAHGRLIKLHGWHNWRWNDWEREHPDKSVADALMELFISENYGDEYRFSK